MDSLTCEIIYDFQDTMRQQIAGQVAIHTKKEIILEQAFIEIFGIAKSNWYSEKPVIKLPAVHKKGKKFSRKDVFYFSKHKFIDIGTTFIYHKGIRQYPFTCDLPVNLPPTWTGEYGSIKYTGRVVIIDSSHSSFVHTERLFISPRRNLKNEEHLLCEARRDICRTFRYAAVNLGAVYISVWLPLCGIAAGQGLPVLCSIRNNSKVVFGGLVFVLTRIETYRSQYPVESTKTVRTDICRVARVVDIVKGKNDYYSVLETSKDLFPTNQFWKCKSCQLTYEVWVSVRGAFPRYHAYNYPNIDTPGIPLIIGTEPLLEWDKNYVTAEVMKMLFSSHPPVIMEPAPPDDEVQEMLIHVKDELDEEMAKKEV